MRQEFLPFGPRDDGGESTRIADPHAFMETAKTGRAEGPPERDSHRVLPDGNVVADERLGPSHPPSHLSQHPPEDGRSRFPAFADIGDEGMAGSASPSLEALKFPFTLSGEQDGHPVLDTMESDQPGGGEPPEVDVDPGPILVQPERGAPRRSKQHVELRNGNRHGDVPHQ